MHVAIVSVTQKLRLHLILLDLLDGRTEFVLNLGGER